MEKKTSLLRSFLALLVVVFMAFRFGNGTFIKEVSFFNILSYLVLSGFIYFYLRKKFPKKKIIKIELIAFNSYFLGIVFGFLGIDILTSDLAKTGAVIYIIFLWLFAMYSVMKMAKEKKLEGKYPRISILLSGVFDLVVGIFLFFIFVFSSIDGDIYSLPWIFLGIVPIYIGIMTLYYYSKIPKK